MNSTKTDPLMHEHLQGAIEEMRQVSEERRKQRGGEQGQSKKLHATGAGPGSDTSGLAPLNLAKRLWRRTLMGGPDECWPWQGAGVPKGYGVIKVSGRQTYSHRVAWTVTYGAIPEGLCVCHHCDNPPCCNPSHLFLGTIADNAKDAQRKGRLATGKRNGAYLHPERIRRGEQIENSKLTEDDVRAIRSDTRKGSVLALVYDIRESTISRIRSHKRWGHVK